MQQIFQQQIKRETKQRVRIKQSPVSFEWPIFLCRVHVSQCWFISVSLCSKYHNMKHTGTMTHFWLLTHQMCERWICLTESTQTEAGTYALLLPVGFSLMVQRPCSKNWNDCWVMAFMEIKMYNLCNDDMDCSQYVTLGLPNLAHSLQFNFMA